MSLLPIPVVQSFTVNPAAQTIAFGALSNVVFGATPFALTATASSGRAVIFASRHNAGLYGVGRHSRRHRGRYMFDYGESAGQRELRGRDAGIE